MLGFQEPVAMEPANDTRAQDALVTQPLLMEPVNGPKALDTLITQSASVMARVEKFMEPPTMKPAEKVVKEKKLRLQTSPTRHPVHLRMIKEALVSLKERTTSSKHSIAKYLEEKYGSRLPPNFRHTLSVQLKCLSQSGKLTKVKYSFKLSDEKKKAPKNTRTTEACARASKKVKKSAGGTKTAPKTLKTSARIVQRPSRTTKRQSATAKMKVKPSCEVSTPIGPAKAAKTVKLGKAPAKKSVSQGVIPPKTKAAGAKSAGRTKKK